MYAWVAYLIDTPLLRMGGNLSILRKTCFSLLQPEGLEDGSRWSRGKKGATTRIRRAAGLHPGRGARTIVPLLDYLSFWHPSGVEPSNSTVFRWSFPLCPGTTTDYHLSTLRVDARVSLLSRRF